MTEFHGLPKPLVPVMIGIPTMGKVRMEWVIGMLTVGLPINTVGATVPVYNRPVAEARNILVDMAIRNKNKYLIFIDDDTIPGPNTIRRLMWDMENNPHISVVGGISPVKQEPAAALIFDEPGQGPSFNWKVGDFRKVWGVGMGAAIIRVEDLVKHKDKFEQVKVRDYPVRGALLDVTEYFRSASDFVPDATDAKEGWSFSMSEDLYFCEKMKQAGCQVWADCGIINNHIDTEGRQYEISMCRPFLDPVQGLKKIYLDLGCGPVYREWEDGTRVLRVDADPEVHPDYVQDVRKLNIRDNFADGVLLSHVIEHFTRFEAESVLDEAVRVTKDGGAICISCPDMEAIMGLWQAGDTIDALRALYGSQDSPFQYHYNVWDFKMLEEAMKSRGCTWMTKTTNPNEPYSMNVWFVKGDVNLYAEEKKRESAASVGADANVQQAGETEAGAGEPVAADVPEHRGGGGERRRAGGRGDRKAVP